MKVEIWASYIENSYIFYHTSFKILHANIFLLYRLFSIPGENKSVYLKECVKIEGLSQLEMLYICGKNRLCI